MRFVLAVKSTFCRTDGEPILSDPDDEPLVQLAIESDALCIVSHNVRHLKPAARLGVEVLRPREFLDKLRL